MGHVFTRCTLGELRATAAALDEAKREVHLVEFPVVSVDRPGYTELTNALRVLQTALKDHADSRQQKADSYALMRYIYRLTGQLEDALQMHELCVNHGGSEFDTIGHGLMMAEQDEEGLYVLEFSSRNLNLIYTQVPTLRCPDSSVEIDSCYPYKANLQKLKV